jgi:hypothetical protein
MNFRVLFLLTSVQMKLVRSCMNVGMIGTHIGKVKFTPKKVTKVHWGSKGIALLFVENRC